MKKIFSIVLMAALFAVSFSCDESEGPTGPAGADGRDGVDGADGRDLTEKEIALERDPSVDPQGQLDSADFILQLLHYADVDGNEETALASVDEFSAIAGAFQNDADYGDHTLFVSSGDIMIPGPRFYAAENSTVRGITGSNEPGHADVAFANYMNVDASAVGNHELDQGPGEFADALQSEERNGVVFPGSDFPFLTVNIDFSLDEDFDDKVVYPGDETSNMTGQIAEYAIKTVNGERIGIIGASTPTLPNITTTGDLEIFPGPDFATIQLATIIQRSVNELMWAGVDKIVLLAHMQQISVEKDLATMLTGVDIIVAGGSNTRMGDDDDELFTGDASFDETYPYIAVSAAEEPVLVVNVDGDYKYLGRMVVGFDEDGIVNVNSLDDELNGAYASTSSVVTAVSGTANTEVVTLRDAIDGVIADQFSNVVGYSSVYLDGRRREVRTRETNLGNLTAEANLWYANLLSTDEVHVSIKNGGGIRTEMGSAVLPAGSSDPADIVFSAPDNNEVTEGHLRATLRFDNGLVRLTATAEELKDIMEHAVAASEDGATPGQFPQIAGMTIRVDLDGTPRTGANTGSRIIEMTVGTTTVYSGGAFQVPVTDTYNLVTLNFLANGGDDYPFIDLSAPDRRNYYSGTGFGESTDFPDETLANDPGNNTTFSYTGGEQDALAEYMFDQFPAASPFNEAHDAAPSRIFFGVQVF